MKNNSHNEHPPMEAAEKGSTKGPNSSGHKKKRREEKEETKKTSKTAIEGLHAAIAKETEADTENWIIISVVRSR